MLYPNEDANGARSDKNITFLSKMIVYFQPTCAGCLCTKCNFIISVQRWKTGIIILHKAA